MNSSSADTRLIIRETHHGRTRDSSRRRSTTPIRPGKESASWPPCWRWRWPSSRSPRTEPTRSDHAEIAANDAWAHYQSTRVKYHNLELGESLVGVLGAKGEPADEALADYAARKKKITRTGARRSRRGKVDDRAADAAEHRALRYDIGEGLLEIALVLSSLYFISRKRMFPVIGIVAGLAGAAIAITGLMV